MLYKKVLIWTASIIGVLVILLFSGFQYMKSKTKKASPEVTETYANNGKDITVFYCAPSKKNRPLFGSLVPFGEVWRTGANEATTFSTSKDLQIDGKTLPAGKYTLWTIPNKESWTVIWNKKQYGWGVDFSSKAARDPAEDALKVTVPVETTYETIEKFTISFEEKKTLQMVMAWDETKVAVPIQ